MELVATSLIMATSSSCTAHIDSFLLLAFLLKLAGASTFLGTETHTAVDTSVRVASDMSWMHLRAVHESLGKRSSAVQEALIADIEERLFPTFAPFRRAGMGQ